MDENNGAGGTDNAVRVAGSESVVAKVFDAVAAAGMTTTGVQAGLALGEMLIGRDLSHAVDAVSTAFGRMWAPVMLSPEAALHVQAGNRDAGHVATPAHAIVHVHQELTAIEPRDLGPQEMAELGAAIRRCLPPDAAGRPPEVAMLIEVAGSDELYERAFRELDRDGLIVVSGHLADHLEQQIHDNDSEVANVMSGGTPAPKLGLP